MRYIKIPKEIGSQQIRISKHSFSCAQYKTVIIKNDNTVLVRDFLSRNLIRNDLGKEVGSLSYIAQSPKYFIRTKALQKNLFLPDITKESTLPILPKSFVIMDLREGDFLISKDSNIGEAVILDKDYKDFMLSGAIYRLPIKKRKYYLFAMVKHDIFREQLDFMVPKSATIRHAKTMFLDVKIPLPKRNTDNTIKYIELLTQSVIKKEIEIRNKNGLIHKTVIDELNSNQKSKKFVYKHPSFEELLNNKRLDAGFYGEDHKSKIFPTQNYKHGFKSLDNQGMQLIPGPSLELRILGTRVDSKVEKKGFYRLVTPKQITDLGTIEYYEYLGTPKEIKPIEFGDILFGESGTGRSMVYLENHKNTINNAHAHILRPIENECTIEKAIFIRAVLAHYKEIGIIDHMTVGGQGGHLSPSYFDRIFIPNFPEPKQKEIAKLYYNPDAKLKTGELTLDNYLEKDKEFNKSAGITELDHSAKRIKKHLDFVIDQIVNDIDVNIDFTFLDN